MKSKGKILMFIAAVLTIAYLIYSVSYWGTIETGSDAEAVGAGIAAALVLPHLVVTVIAFIFNALGFIMHHRGFALTSAILYAVAAVLFPAYFMFVIVQMILMFVAFARIPK